MVIFTEILLLCDKKTGIRYPIIHSILPRNCGKNLSNLAVLYHTRETCVL